MTYAPDLVAWLIGRTRALQAAGMTMTPLDVLRLEHAYPGLAEDMLTLLWQIDLIRDQYEADKR